MMPRGARCLSFNHACVVVVVVVADRQRERRKEKTKIKKKERKSQMVIVTTRGEWVPATERSTDEESPIEIKRKGEGSQQI